MQRLEDRLEQIAMFVLLSDHRIDHSVLDDFPRSERTIVRYLHREVKDVILGLLLWRQPIVICEARMRLGADVLLFSPHPPLALS